MNGWCTMEEESCTNRLPVEKIVHQLPLSKCKRVFPKYERLLKKYERLFSKNERPLKKQCLVHH